MGGEIRFFSYMKTVFECARALLADLPVAVSGRGGHSATFRAACELARLGLADTEALALLEEWNGTHCQPPWTEVDLLHKWKSARLKVEARRPGVGSQVAIRDVWKIERKLKPEVVCSPTDALLLPLVEAPKKPVEEADPAKPATRSELLVPAPLPKAPPVPPVPPRAPLLDTPATRFKRLQWSLLAGRILNGDFDAADPATVRQLSAGLINAGDALCSYACSRLSAPSARPVSGRQSWMPLDLLPPMFGPDARFVPLLRDSELPLVRHQGVSLAATKSPWYRHLFLFADAAVALGGGLCSIEFRSDCDLELFLDVNPALESSLLWLPSKGGTLFLKIQGEYPKSAVLNGGSAEWRADGQLSVVWKDSFPVDLWKLAFTNSAPLTRTFAEIHWPKRWLLPWAGSAVVTPSACCKPVAGDWERFGCHRRPS